MVKTVKMIGIDRYLFDIKDVSIILRFVLAQAEKTAKNEFVKELRFNFLLTTGGF